LFSGLEVVSIYWSLGRIYGVPQTREKEAHMKQSDWDTIQKALTNTPPSSEARIALAQSVKSSIGRVYLAFVSRDPVLRNALGITTGDYRHFLRKNGLLPQFFVQGASFDPSTFRTLYDFLRTSRRRRFLPFAVFVLCVVVGAVLAGVVGTAGVNNSSIMTITSIAALTSVVIGVVVGGFLMAIMILWARRSRERLYVQFGLTGEEVKAAWANRKQDRLLFDIDYRAALRPGRVTLGSGEKAGIVASTIIGALFVAVLAFFVLIEIYSILGHSYAYTLMETFVYIISMLPFAALGAFIAVRLVLRALHLRAH
jgi:hypothetical protein